jgi:hypothetical protein
MNSRGFFQYYMDTCGSAHILHKLCIYLVRIIQHYDFFFSCVCVSCLLCMHAYRLFASHFDKLFSTNALYLFVTTPIRNVKFDTKCPGKPWNTQETKIQCALKQ